MTLVTWLLYSKIWDSTTVDNGVTLINLPAIFLGVIVSGNVHQPSEIASYLAIFAEWALLGAGAAWAVIRMKKGKGDA